MNRSHRVLALGVTLVSLLASCTDDGGGGSTYGPIADIDASGPGISLTVASGNEWIAVTPDSGSEALAPTGMGPITLSASADDHESGVQDIQIWIRQKTTTCTANGTCSTKQPTVGAPAYSSPVAQGQPGELAELVRTLTVPHDPALPGRPEPGGSWSVELTIWAVAVNHLSGKTETASAVLSWSYP
jgi:hypothetical protein